MKTPLRLSILDLAAIGPEETIRESFRGSVALAKLAEKAGYHRIWYAEHHSIPTIASAATSVLIAHIAAQTETIRLGSGGVMLPNHSPLTIAEQYGTLAELHPGRIDLGLGRAPGGDRAVLAALRRDVQSADRFPADVVELQGLLSKKSPLPGVEAIPGAGTNVPLYILGSSLFGAELAARLGLPYAFASHFAPAALFEAIDLYRRKFRPSEGLQEPYVMAGINVHVAESAEEAEQEVATVRRIFIRNLIGRNSERAARLSDEDLLQSPHAAFVEQMFSIRAVGLPKYAANYLREFQAQTSADELITVHHATSVHSRLRSVRLLGEELLSP